jgi:GTPase SAR1 family protein
LESWLSEIEENSNDKAEIVIVGNKKDQYDGRDLILPEAINKFKRYQTSAKTGHNVSKVFSELTASILNKL